MCMSDGLSAIKGRDWIDAHVPALRRALAPEHSIPELNLGLKTPISVAARPVRLYPGWGREITMLYDAGAPLLARIAEPGSDGVFAEVTRPGEDQALPALISSRLSDLAREIRFSITSSTTTAFRRSRTMGSPQPTSLMGWARMRCSDQRVSILIGSGS